MNTTWIVMGAWVAFAVALVIGGMVAVVYLTSRRALRKAKEELRKIYGKPSCPNHPPHETLNDMWCSLCSIAKQDGAYVPLTSEALFATLDRIGRDKVDVPLTHPWTSAPHKKSERPS